MRYGPWLDLDLTEAIEAAARALAAAHDDDYDHPSVAIYSRETAEKFRANYRGWAQAALEAAAPILERQIRSQQREELRAPMRRLRSALVAVVDRLDVPYDPNVPECTPWTRFVKPAVKQLEAAIARGDVAAGEQTGDGNG